MPIQARNHFLNANFMHRLHMCNDSRNLAAITYREMLERQTQPNTTSCIHNSIYKNCFWTGIARKYRTPLITRPLRPNNNFPRVAVSGASNESLPEEAKDEYLFLTLTEMQNKTSSSTAKILEIPKKRSVHPLIASGATISRGTFRPILLWILGNICIHQECKKCGRELSRQHGIDCADVENNLRAVFGPPPAATQLQLTHNATILDQYIAAEKFTEESVGSAKALGIIVEKIRWECAGHKATPDVSNNSIEDEIEDVLHGIEEGHTHDALAGIIQRNFTPNQAQSTQHSNGRNRQQSNRNAQLPARNNTRGRGQGHRRGRNR